MNRLTKISLGLNVVLFVITLGLFIFAIIQRMEAVNERISVTHCEKMVIMERNRADSLAVVSVTQRIIAEEAMQAAELARKRAIEATQIPD